LHSPADGCYFFDSMILIAKVFNAPSLHTLLYTRNTYLCTIMEIEILKSKIHRATITEANLHYVGSLTLDEKMMDAAQIIEYEKVQVVNVNNGTRIETYVIKGKRGSGVCCLNGPAARQGAVGDVVIIISYATMIFEEAKNFKPWVIFPKEGNLL
jgi:aspartate 1-decarboxylase